MATLAHHKTMASELACSPLMMRCMDRARRLQRKADIDWRMLRVFLEYRRRGKR